MKESHDEISSMQITEYTTGEALFEFVKSQMKYDEVMNLYRLLKNDLEGSPIIQNFTLGADFETAVKIYEPKRKDRLIKGD